MDHRRYELVTLAAARALRSSYCALAHGRILAEEHLAASTLIDVMTDHRDAGLDEVETAVLDFAEKVAIDATSVTAADVERLRTLGLSELEILDVALASAVRCLVSKTIDALGVQADRAFIALEPELREALVVGRPIASG